MGAAPLYSQRAIRSPRSGMSGSTRRGPVIRRAVSSLLADLGSTEAAVSRSLTDAGVAGNRGDPRDCVVARYLNAIVGAEPDVNSVSVGRSVVWMSRRGLRPAVRVSIPAPVRQFIMAFDAGVHPELEGRYRSRARR
jgi:hypothetical protein